MGTMTVGTGVSRKGYPLNQMYPVVVDLLSRQIVAVSLAAPLLCLTPSLLHF